MFIVGLFAETAPNLRTPNSDIDVICSDNLNEKQIRNLIQAKFPNIPTDIKLDLIQSKPINGIIYFPYCYWQNDSYLTLLNNCDIQISSKIYGKTLTCMIRNPNKNDLHYYLNNNNTFEIINVNQLIIL